MNEPVYEVAIVLEPNFAERLRTLTGPREIWALASPQNVSVSAALRQEGFQTGFTLFHPEGAESAAQACLRIVEDVAEHHGESAEAGPWTAIRVIGTPLDGELEARFRELGAATFVPSEAGFTCTRDVPTTPEALITALSGTLAARGIPATTALPSVSTMEEAARALFFLAVQGGAGHFTVWSEERGEGRVAAVSVFIPEPGDPASTVGRSGNKQVVRQFFESSLYEPLADALSRLSRRGSAPNRPDRGDVPFPSDAADPDFRFLVEFQNSSRGSQVLAIARTREARALFPALSELPLSAPEAAYLSERLWELDTLFQGRPIVFTGPADAGREASFLSALAAIPGDLNALALVERARPYDPRLGAIVVSAERPLVQAIRAVLRQDPDLVFAETVRTDEELTMILTAAQTGHGVLYGMEESPEEALARMQKVASVLPLFVHHTRDAATGARVASLQVRDPASPLDAPRVIPWSPAG